MNDTRKQRPLTQRDFELRLELLQRIDRMIMSMLIPAGISLASLFSSFSLAFCSAERWCEADMKEADHPGKLECEELMTGQHNEHE